MWQTLNLCDVEASEEGGHWQARYFWIGLPGLVAIFKLATRPLVSIPEFWDYSHSTHTQVFLGF